MKKTALLWMLISISITTQAQEIYTFEKCLEIAVKQNPDYAFDELEFQKAVIAHRAASLNRLPDLNANANTSLNNGRSLDPITYQYNTQTFLFNNISLQSRWMLYDGNRQNILTSQGDVSRTVQQYKLENTKLNLTKDLLISYADVLMQQEFLRLWETRLVSLDEQKEKLRMQVISGRKTESSLHELDIELDRARQSMEEIRFRASVSEIKLKNIMNVPLDKTISVVNPEVQTWTIDSVQYLDPARIKQLVEQHVAYKENSWQVIQAQHQIRYARSYYKPSLSLNSSIATGYSSLFQQSGIATNTGVARQFENNFYQNVSLNLYIPIFSRFQTSSSVKRNKVAHLQSEELQTQRYLKLREVLVSLNEDQRYSANRYLFVSRALDNFSLILQETELSLSSGRIDLFEYLFKEQQKFSLEQNKIELKYRYLVASKSLELFENNEVKWE